MPGRVVPALVRWLVGLGFMVALFIAAISHNDGLSAILALVFGTGFAMKAAQSGRALARGRRIRRGDDR